MKRFHISDILSVTTGRLVSSRHMEGIYDILNFITGDNLFTHQLPRAMRECEPWLKTQFPYLFPDSPTMKKCLDSLDKLIALDGDNKESRDSTIKAWVDAVRLECGQFRNMLPDMLPVYEMGADMHTRIDPLEELQAMVGDKKIFVIE